MNERETFIATTSFAAGWDAALDEARKAVAIVTVNKDTSYEMRMQALAVIEALWKEAMTDHLPECLHDDATYGLHGLCICAQLRACEQRVKRESDETFREANVPNRCDPDVMLSWSWGNGWHKPDTLREEKK